MGLAWRPAGEAICSEMYSTSKTNLPGSVRLHDLQESWARMFPEMARYTNKADEIGARVPQYPFLPIQTHFPSDSTSVRKPGSHGRKWNLY